MIVLSTVQYIKIYLFCFKVLNFVWNMFFQSFLKMISKVCSFLKSLLSNLSQVYIQAFFPLLNFSKPSNSQIKKSSSSLRKLLMRCANALFGETYVIHWVTAADFVIYKLAGASFMMYCVCECLAAARHMLFQDDCMKVGMFWYQCL